MIEKIVTNLETSRELKDLGVVQESCFYWVVEFDEPFIVNYQMLEFWKLPGYELKKPKVIASAWTSTELGAMDDFLNLNNISEYLKISGLPIENWNQNLKKWREG